MFQENVAVGIVPEYFNKYYNTAVNVYLSGSAIGIIVSPLVTSWLLDTYGWRGALLLLCGINMQSVVLGSLVPQRSPSKEESEERLRLLQSTQMSKQNDSKCPSLRGVLQNTTQVLNFQLLQSLPFTTQVVLPSAISGYIMASWMIYIISYALSNGASMKDSSTVAMCGGVGYGIIRIALPTLNKYLAYRKLMYTAATLVACSLAATTFVHSIVGMSASSLIFGMTYGTLVTQIYVAVKDVVRKDQYLNAVAWLHLAYGFGAIAGGSLTGMIFSTGMKNPDLNQRL